MVRGKYVNTVYDEVWQLGKLATLTGQPTYYTRIRRVHVSLFGGLEHILLPPRPSYCEVLLLTFYCKGKKDIVISSLKLNWISSQEQKDQVLAYVKEMLEAEVVHKDKKRAREDGNTYDLAQGLSEDPEPKRPKLFSFLPASSKVENQQGSEGSTVSMNLLLKQYVDEGTQPFYSDPLLYWKEAPHAMSPLRNLARDVLGCTATSAPSERVFSIAGNYFTANRAQLGVSSFRSMIMIKCNSELFQKLPTSATAQI